MKISQLEEKLSDYGSGGYQMLEMFVIELLRIELESEGKALQYTAGATRASADAVAPEGMGQIAGPLLIEIIYSFTPRTIGSIESLLKRRKDFEGYSLLVISFRKIDLPHDYFENLAGLLKGSLFL